MKFLDDSLRVCPNCKGKVSCADEPQRQCPHCGQTVWFFNFHSLSQPPELPKPRPAGLLENPTTTLLLVTIILFGIVAILAFRNTLVIAVVCCLTVIGFAVFSLLRHQSALRVEQDNRYLDRLIQYSGILRGRVTELTDRYNALLRTGNQRVDIYYREIYLQAEKVRKEAEDLRYQALVDREAVGSVEQRIYDMAARHIDSHLKWASQKLRADPENYQRNKTILNKAFDFVESVGYSVPPGMRRDALKNLKQAFEQKMREQALKDEQRRIKQQMREEAKLRREREAAIREAEKQERELQRQLEEALREHRGQFDAEVEALRRQLEEAHASSERAKSMAQLTKAGHVYILSNIGSFGEDIYKVGMTRRLEPADRVKELGDASVPFPFDVHAMISCDDAPTLEKSLHRALTSYRVNRINLRKEYFKVSLEEILKAVRAHHGEIEYVAEPEALEYRDGLSVRPEDLVELEAELLEIGADLDDDSDD